MKTMTKRLTAENFGIGYCPFCGVVHTTTNESQEAAYEILDDWEDGRYNRDNLSACPKCLAEHVRVCGDCGRLSKLPLRNGNAVPDAPIPVSESPFKTSSKEWKLRVRAPHNVEHPAFKTSSKEWTLQVLLARGSAAQPFKTSSKEWKQNALEHFSKPTSAFKTSSKEWKPCR